MADLLTEFERDCTDAGVKPTDALRRGGVHPTLWPKWRGGMSPTLKNFEAAKRGLDELIRERGAEEAAA